MKKKQVIITLIILVTLISVMILSSFRGGTYTISIKTVDSFSPDRTLEVYKNNKKIDYKKIQYDDNAILCYSDNPTVAYTDLIDVEELVIVLKNNRKVMAKIVEK